MNDSEQNDSVVRPDPDRLLEEVRAMSQFARNSDRPGVMEAQKWLRKSEQGDKWNRCLIEGMIVLSETGARDEQTTPP